ncbi:MAG: hypothetical protein NTX50_12835 [Candidatus Sumerlaeota bacterium]|nr:hypothetical protein [Candidatus Sumerlaeota bacterium]
MSEKIENPEGALQDARTAHSGAVAAPAKAQAESKGAVDHLEELRKSMDDAIEADAQTALAGGKPGKNSGEALRHAIAVQERVIVELRKREALALADERAARLALHKAEWLVLSKKRDAVISAIEKAQENLDAAEKAKFDLRYEEDDLRKKRLAVESEIKAASPAPPPKEKPFSMTVAGDPPPLQVKQTIKGQLQPTILYKPKPPMTAAQRDARERLSA